jgi:hypothetical protein
MRTKTLLLTAAVFAAGLGASMAQVYSVNAVGYVNTRLTNQFTMISNPLNTTNNTIGSLLANVPDFSNFYRWNGGAFDIATFIGGWDHPEYTLNPGEGGFIGIDPGSLPFTITFVGDVMQGSLTNPIPAGYSIRSSQVPQAGGITSQLGLAALSDFDNLYKWVNDHYVIYTYVFGGWDPSEPVLNVGESVFINASTSGNWTRTFSVN